MDNLKALDRDLTRGFTRAFDELPEGSLPTIPVKGYTFTVTLTTDADPPHEKGAEGKEEEPVVVYIHPLAIALIGAAVGVIGNAIFDGGSKTCTSTTRTETTTNADGSSTTTTTVMETCTTT